MSNIYNERFYNALQKKTQSVPPIWMMRQAGRYHQHYQNLKKRYSFEELCRQPDLACEVTLGPINDFDFDAAILFSDILFPLDFLGMKLSFNPGPNFKNQLSQTMLENYHLDEFEDYIQFQIQALQQIRNNLSDNKSLIGFVGGPLTLYHFATRQNSINDNLFSLAMSTLEVILKKNIELQFRNEIDILMIFDTEANNLSDEDFRKFCAPFINEIAQLYPNKIGYFTKNISFEKLEILKNIKNLKLTVLGSQQNLFDQLPQTHLTLQGNFSNELLAITDKDNFKSALDGYLELVQSYGVEKRDGWIASLDHGVQKTTPEANIHLFIEQIRTKLA